MTRHRHGLTGALDSLGSALLAAATLALGAAASATAGPGSTDTYYTAPCLDSDGDRIEDFLTQVPDQFLDLFVLFDGPTWDPVATRAQVQQILDLSSSSATIRYVGQWSPYVFLDHLDFGEAHVTPEELEAILLLDHAIGARAYERFVLNTTVVSSTPLPPEPEPLPHPEAPAGAPAPAPGPAPGPIPIPIAPVPSVLIYIVDSGIDDPDQYWGINAALQNPLSPKKARDPKDMTSVHHGTFVKRVALTTLAKASPSTPGWEYRQADVRVAVGPNGETTTLELTRGFDAVMAHLQSEQAQGRFYRAIVNVSYDTDGPIANHDIIYPNPGGPLDPRGAGAALHPIDEDGPDGPDGGSADGAAAARPGTGVAPASPAPPDPCQVELFDNVYRILSDDHDGVIAVGAGNDGLQAAFIINELGRSVHATVVLAALEPASGQPAGYSCYGNAPDGAPQNGHPDLAAVGTGSAPGFAYLLQGTSIATAFGSGMAGAALLEQPTLTPEALEAWLVAKGSKLPDSGNRWYGAARLHLPWEGRTASMAPGSGSGAPIRPPTLLFPGPGSRIVVRTEASGPVVVRVFSVTGRLVRTLLDGPVAPGRHELAFDGRADDGSTLPGGLYFVRGSAPDGSSVTKLLIRRVESPATGIRRQRNPTRIDAYGWARRAPTASVPGRYRDGSCR